MNLKHIKIVFFAFLLIGMVLATGCTTKTVIRNQVIPILPDDGLIQDHPVPTPTHSPEQYARMSTDKKEDFLVKYIGRLLTTIGLEQADKQGLREWKRMTLEKIEQKNQQQPTQ